jgi:flagellar motor switch protein FliN/FliY
MNPQNPAAGTPGYARAQFGDLQADAGTGGGEVSLDLILDVGVTVALEVGRTRITVRELLQLTQGSILELDRLAGEPLDVLVNGVRIARGEVVVVNEKFGIRLIEVVSPSERMERVK